jgi:hypothetical protein
VPSQGAITQRCRELVNLSGLCDTSIDRFL